MATRDAGQSGVITLGTPQTGGQPMVATVDATFSFANSSSVLYFKMQGSCSTHGWDSWVNRTSDESGRDIHGTQVAGTVIASWFVPVGL